MKITVKNTTKTEVDVPLPCYRKTEYYVALILTENKYIQISHDGEYFSVRNSGLFMEEFFNKDSQDATKAEFDLALGKVANLIKAIE